jgi:RNA chaperone Hfq
MDTVDDEGFNKDTVEDKFLDKVIKNHVSMTVFLANGVKLEGVVLDHGPRTILLSNKEDRALARSQRDEVLNRAQLLYKVSIASILPTTQVSAAIPSIKGPLIVKR